MNALISCLTGQHNLGLVGLAGTICVLSSLVAMVLLQRGHSVVYRSKWLWLGIGGTFGGFGIWATHFIAMLAYDLGVVVGYEPKLTLLSLVIAILATVAALVVTVPLDGIAGRSAAGLLFALGVASMHFTGMRAMEFPGEIEWHSSFVVASLAFGIIFAVPAFHVAFAVRHRLAALGPSTALMVLSVVSLHFIAMAGVTIVPGAESLDALSLLSPTVMIITIATVSISLLASGFSAAIFAVRGESKAAASENKFKLLVQGVTDYAIYMLDLDGRVSNWNAGAQRAKGYTAGEIVGKHFELFYSEEDRRNGVPQRALATARNEGKFEAEGWRYRKDGTSFWAYVIIDPIYGDDGRLVGYAKITKDNTSQKAAADRLARVSSNLDVALQNMSQGLCMFDRHERLVLANDRYSQLFGFPEGFVQPGTMYLDLVEHRFRLQYPRDEVTALQLAKVHYEEHMAIIQSGGGADTYTYANGLSLQHVYNVMNDGGWVVTFEDITERLKSEEKISLMARHDVLTGLANRAQHHEDLTEELEAARRAGNKVAVIGIDLDRFKEINDQHGHAAGDGALMALAERMTAVLKPGEFIARFGGDEFSAFKRFDDTADLEDFIARLQGSVNAEIDIEGFAMKTGGSFGVALYPQDGETIAALLANADLAMYRAKASLIQRVCFYEMAMDEAARQRTLLVNDLWAAIDRGQLRLNYQVQKTIATGETSGYEVLLRWDHAEMGDISPAEFIPLAEECGAILPIGEWVLREACREAASWTTGAKIAVNLSPVQLANADMATIIHQILLETGLSPSRLEIEITETSIISNKERSLHAMRQIRNLGVAIALDDFGTGYSSLETLRTFPFDKIKLDKSFMDDVETSQQAKAIVRAILALGQSLSVPVLAEGVETQAQLDILFNEHCDEAQGYYLGKPMPIEQIFAAVQDRVSREVA